MTAPRGTSRHWTCHRVISRRESPFMVLAKQNILNAKREKRTFCARLLHPQTRLMHPDRTHPSTMIQAYSSNTLKSPSLRTQLASPPYNDKCGARTHDQLSTEKRPLPRLEPMNTLAHRVTVIHWALTVGWPQTQAAQSAANREDGLKATCHVPHTRPTVCRAPTYGYPYGYAWATLWVRHVLSRGPPLTGPFCSWQWLTKSQSLLKSNASQKRSNWAVFKTLCHSIYTCWLERYSHHGSW